MWTVSGGASYTGKRRAAVIVQDNHLDTDSVTICPFTTDPTDAPLLRLLIEPDAG
ncbi:MAG: type II toxin-antitoxin system PemK/MazF family toxin [Streptosporangiaceae bacterium]